MANPAFDVTKITVEIIKIFQEIIKLRKIGKGDLHTI
jgi:hypothetical protein